MNKSVTRGRPRDFNRDTALEAAMETFWQYGYEASSLSILKANMGINSPSLYAAFGNKEALFAEAVNFYLEKYGSYREKVLSEATTAAEGVAELFEQTIKQFSAGNHHNGCLVVLAALCGSKESQPVQQILNNERRRTATLFAERLSKGQKDGDIDDSRDVQILAEYLATLLFGLTIQFRDGVAPDVIRGIVKLALKTLD